MTTQTIAIATATSIARTPRVRRRWRSRLGQVSPPRTPRDTSRELQYEIQRQAFRGSLV